MMLAMQLHPDGETTQPTAVTSNRSFAEWLEDLAAGECDWQVMFRGVAPAVTANPDSGWELLALVDQHYRLHRISEQDFQGLNSSLQALLLGPHAGGAKAPSPKAPAVTTPPVSPPSVAPEVTVQIPAAAIKPPPVRAPAVNAAAVKAPAVKAAAVKAPAANAQPAAPKIQAAERKAEPLLKSVADTGQSLGPRTLVVNEVLRNRYRVRGILGHGGMGTVYAAIDEFRLDQSDGGQRVAIKVLHTEIIKRPKLVAELRAEFQRLQSLSHPNIVRVHDFDRDDDLTFFTMEQLSGAPLNRVLASHTGAPIHRPYALTIIRQVGAAVAYAHSRGVVHGDLNPGNIFITDQGEVRVLDFGASYRHYHEPTIPDLEELARTAVATPSYASCDVLQGSPANVRDDLYAMACVSYVLLAGRHPFRGLNALQARAARMSPRRPPGMSARQWRALRAGLCFDREQRPADMQEWLDQLSAESDATSLPVLTTVMAPRAPGRSNAGWVTGAVIALAAALCWGALENPDSVSRSAADLKGSAESLWNSIRGDVATGTATAPIPDEPAADSTVPPAPPAAKPTAPPAARTAAPALAAGNSAAHLTTGSAAPVRAGAAPSGATAAHARIEMAADELEVTPMNPVAAVIVRRRESYRDNVNFTWWTESGTAKPGKDFVPVSPRTEYLLSGEREAQLLVPVVTDPRRHESRSFYVVIDQPSDGARLGSRTLTMVTIPPSD
jgi:serine/threonine protein kinase